MCGILISSTVSLPARTAPDGRVKRKNLKHQGADSILLKSAQFAICREFSKCSSIFSSRLSFVWSVHSYHDRFWLISMVTIAQIMHLLDTMNALVSEHPMTISRSTQFTVQQHAAVAYRMRS